MCIRNELVWGGEQEMKCKECGKNGIACKLRSNNRRNKCRQHCKCKPLIKQFKYITIAKRKIRND